MNIEKALNELNVNGWFITAGNISPEEDAFEAFTNLRAVETEEDFNERVRILVSVDENGNEVISDEIGVTWEQVKAKADEISQTGTSEEARNLRTSLLTATDWTANSDVTMTAEMAAYRQALRDITDQDGFPNDITWPTKPE